jgi:hypothetical protein
VGSLLVGLWALTAAAAIAGPAFALPAAPQLFAFRLMILAFAAVGAVAVATGALRIPPTAVGVELGLLAAWGAVLMAGVGWAEDAALATRYVGLWLIYAALAAGTALAITTPERLRAVLWGLLGIVVVAIAGALAELTLGIEFPQNPLADETIEFTTGVRSFFVNPNNLATCLMLAAAYLIAAGIVFGRRARPVLWVVGIPAGVALIASGSRGSLLALGLIGAGAAFFLGRSPDPRQRSAGRGLAVLLAAGVVMVGIAAASDGFGIRALRVESLVSESQSGRGSGGVRYGLAKEGMRAVVDSLGFGVGPGNAESTVRRLGGIGGRVNLHFFFLEVLVDGGVLALAAFGSLYVLLVRRTLRAAALGSFLALIGFLLGNLGPSGAIAFGPMWMVLGLSMASYAAWRTHPGY